MPICKDCSKVWNPNGRHVMHRGKVICFDCFAERKLEDNGH